MSDSVRPTRVLETTHRSENLTQRPLKKTNTPPNTTTAMTVRNILFRRRVVDHLAYSFDGPRSNLPSRQSQPNGQTLTEEPRGFFAFARDDFFHHAFPRPRTW